MEITDGKLPPMTDEMWRLAGLSWDWYRLPGNTTGGALHITLDDMNVEDHCLDFCGIQNEYGWRPSSPYPPESLALRDEIIAGLRILSEGERALVVHMANPYGSVRPSA